MSENFSERESAAAPTREKNVTLSRAVFLAMLGLSLVMGLFGGFVGSRISPQERSSARDDGSAPAARREIANEDEAVIALVEESTPAVVSIVIKKAVSSRQTEFPFPFFFPAPQPEDNAKDGELRQVGSGSGFFVTSDGLIVTNKHVVADEQAEYFVVTSDGEEHPAKVLARDPVNDIAVVKIEGSGFPALELGDSEGLRVGQTVVAIGNPLGEFANSVSRGIISGLGRDVAAGSGLGEEEQLFDIIQTDAAINPGNSGGPLFDVAGKVIGMNVAIVQGAENIGFALPSNQVRRIVDQVRETGRISTPYLGVRYVLINEAVQENSDLPYSYGALVLRGARPDEPAVIPDSPADAAGIQENDIILELNGKKITEDAPLSAMLRERNVGDRLTLKVWRDGSLRDIEVALGERTSQ